jgi:hypothetical protein
LSALLGHITLERNSFKPFNEVFGKAKISGFVHIVDAPFGLLRAVNTMLMTKAQVPNSFKSEFDALLASDSSTAHRRTLKNFLSCLILFMQAQIVKSSTNNKSSSNSNKVLVKQPIFVVSLVEDCVDMLTVVPEHIILLKAI